MPLRTNVAISTLILLAIVGGVRAVAEEHRRTPEFLQRWYRELNRKYFDNSLPLARIEWADLSVYNRLGRLTGKTMARSLYSSTVEQIPEMKIFKTLCFTKCVMLRLGERRIIRTGWRSGRVWMASKENYCKTTV